MHQPPTSARPEEADSAGWPAPVTTKAAAIDAARQRPLTWKTTVKRALVVELASFTCTFALQRLALGTKGWFAVVTAGLAGNAVTDSLPSGDAADAAVQFGMLTTAGFDTATAVGPPAYLLFRHRY